MSEIDNTVSKGKLYGVAIIYTLAIGFSFMGIKACVPYADSLTILAYRYDFALIGVIVWFAVAKARGRSIKGEKDRPKSKLYLTAAFYIAFMILQITAMFFATSIEGAIVFAIVPIVANIIGRIFLGEKSTVLQNVFVCITVAALIYLVILEATDVTMNPLGTFLMGIGSVCMAISNVFMRYVRGTFKPIEITRTIAIGGFVIFNVIALIRGLIKGNLADFIEPITHPQFVIAAAFLGIFCILLSAQFMAFMLAHMQIVQSTIFGNASTVISIVVGALVLREPFGFSHILCAAVVLIGVIGLSLAPPPQDVGTKKL
jgi:drug/metabolite transporter (DMT)-like permease